MLVYKPILFSTPMVQAILAGKKTMTRRVVPKRLIDQYWEKYKDGPVCDEAQWYRSRSPYFAESLEDNFFACFFEATRLWVRETWCLNPMSGGEKYWYKAEQELNPYCKWRPSIFMPREAARIFLKVTGVRVEHLQDITEEDAESEGVEPCDLDVTEKLRGHHGYVAAFEQLWDQLNEKRGFGWKKNPWVYVVDFELDETRSTLPVIEREGA